MDAHGKLNNIQFLESVSLIWARIKILSWLTIFVLKESPLPREMTA
jgi:hypothetical protein